MLSGALRAPSVLSLVSDSVKLEVSTIAVDGALPGSDRSQSRQVGSSVAESGSVENQS